MSATIVDLYCGASVASTGIEKAFKERGRDVEIIGVNHWEKAIKTASANHHGGCSFICDDLDDLDPHSLRERIGERIEILWASPSCTHHSNAAGGVPRSNQLRSQPDRVIDWIDAYNVECFLMENVKEITTWGPLYKSGPKKRIGRPIPQFKGKYFNEFINKLKERFTFVEWKILNCNDYGDPTSRERFFLQAKQSPIVWPEKKKGGVARDIIDWNVPGKSIFNRPKPLVESTLRRIEHGLERYGGEAYITILRGKSTTRELDKPLPTLTTGQHMMLVQPFLVKYYGNSNTQSIDEPLDTITTKDRFALIQASGGDITYRMLTPRELARAHSFPEDFTFVGGKTDAVKMIGNSVPVSTAKEITLSAIGG